LNDSTAVVHIQIYNNGYQTSSSTELLVIDSYKGKNDTLTLTLPQICNSYLLTSVLDIFKKPGEHLLKLVIDPKGKIPNLKESNKIFQTTFYVYSNSLLLLDPLPLWNVIRKILCLELYPSNQTAD